MRLKEKAYNVAKIRASPEHFLMRSGSSDSASDNSPALVPGASQKKFIFFRQKWYQGCDIYHIHLILRGFCDARQRGKALLDVLWGP
eukprot:g40421.t1